MKLKPRIFIGSSKEGLRIATRVRKRLSGFADCKLWNDRVFQFNKGYFETLVDLLNYYDYGIMVATADDFVTSRGITQQEARDNVLFEFGLFLGRLGRERVFLFLERDIKIPSDLLGVSLPTFSKENGAKQNRTVDQICDQVKKEIRERSGIFDGGIFPSVPLAYGYFHNFIAPTCKNLIVSETAKINGEEKQIHNFRFHVLIPDDLKADMKEKVEAIKFKRHWKQIEVSSGAARPYNFFVDVTTRRSGTIESFDVPTTLKSLHQSITEFLSISKVGYNLKEKLVEDREIRKFKQVLDYLISTDSFAKGHATTEIVDI